MIALCKDLIISSHRRQTLTDLGIGQCPAKGNESACDPYRKKDPFFSGGSRHRGGYAKDPHPNDKAYYDQTYIE